MSQPAFAGWWSQQIWCIPCAEEEHKQAGTHWFPGDGEPCYERNVFGAAKRRKPEHSVIRVGGPGDWTEIPIPPDEGACDNCNAEINTGDRCMAWTTWPDVGDKLEPPAWELDHIEPEVNT
jgi:hypothetical protein